MDEVRKEYLAAKGILALAGEWGRPAHSEDQWEDVWTLIAAAKDAAARASAAAKTRRDHEIVAEILRTIGVTAETVC